MSVRPSLRPNFGQISELFQSVFIQSVFLQNVPDLPVFLALQVYLKPFNDGIQAALQYYSRKKFFRKQFYPPFLRPLLTNYNNFLNCQFFIILLL